MRIGLFGGTFNPPHFGHISLALQLKEAHLLDQVWFIPANISPFRMQEPYLHPQQRQEMVLRAIEGIPDFHLCDLELKRAAPSYTIETIRALKKTYSDDSFFLMLGEDSVFRLQDWYEIKEILYSASLLIGLRPYSNLREKFNSLMFEPELRVAIEKGMTLTKVMEISSTDIRERVNKRLYCGHLAPRKTLDFIYENQLYSSF